MERQFETEFRELKERMLVMGGYVERAIEECTQALILREPARFRMVFEFEKQINQAHIDIDEVCMKLLARQAPLGKDLRMIMAVIKINTDLERMGDQSVNISQNAERYLNEPPIGDLGPLAQMAIEVRAMVRDALDAFVNSDGESAREVISRDDSVDHLKDELFKRYVGLMKTNSHQIDAGLDLLLIARNLERLGDHATNIAEDVIFYVSGEDIRHKNFQK